MLRLAVERSFEILGEALSRLESAEPEMLTGISDHRRIVGFCNWLAHGYDAIEHAIVWEIIETFVPVLMAEVEVLLGEEQPSPPAATQRVPGPSEGEGNSSAGRRDETLLSAELNAF